MKWPKEGIFLVVLVGLFWFMGTSYLGSTGRTSLQWLEPANFAEAVSLAAEKDDQRISLTVDVSLQEGALTVLLWNPAREEVVVLELDGPVQYTNIFHFPVESGEWCLRFSGENVRGSAVVEWQGLKPMEP